MKGEESGLLPTLTLEEAQQRQFHLVDVVSRHFSGEEWLMNGDVGLHPQEKRPRFTAKVERVLAEVFGAEDAVLVRGAGTGAIRSLLCGLMDPGERLFLHRAPIYPTTKETLRMCHFHPVFVDFHDPVEMEDALSRWPRAKVFYIQHARQQPTDTYRLEDVIRRVRSLREDLSVVVDDNYCVFKVLRIGVEAGADYSAFSGFKLLGPEGIGVVVGKCAAVQTIRARNYSGGVQVQGWEAMDLLRSMVFAPVSLAVQNLQVERLCRRLNEGALPGVAAAYMTHSQSKNVIVELEQPLAKEVIAASEALGATVYPVGAESRYEMLPMVYRVSGTFLEARPEMAEQAIRVNPMKAGADTVLRILREAFQRAGLVGR